MNNRLSKAFALVWPQFYRRDKEDLLKHYFRFTNYRKIWGLGIVALVTAALLPLIAATSIHYQLIKQSVDSEIILRTERVTSNARRAVTFFLEEHLNALRFTLNEINYESLTNSDHLEVILRNLKLGFGGLTDLSVIDDSGIQIAYAGPFKLEGKNYSSQRWFVECQRHNLYVSEIFRGYRNLPHIIVAAKSFRPDGSFFILRATLETNQLIKTLSAYKTGIHMDIFLANRSGIIQTPSIFYGDVMQKMALSVPEYSFRTRAVMVQDDQKQSEIMGYAFIATQIADTPFILMVVKQKEGMTPVWQQFRTNFSWFVFFDIVAILVIIPITFTFIVNTLFLADKAKAETLALAEQNNQLASIGQLAAGVAHEINNPLALINETAGYVKDLFVLKEPYNRDDELISYIDDILEAVERCGTITKQLLGFARKFDIRIQKVNLSEVISEVLVFHDKEAAYRNIKVYVDVPQDMPPIETDRGKLQQILVNLVNNAFQAVDNGCILEIQASPAGSDKVHITISDNGCGIPEENVPKIFKPFYTTKDSNQGTGLGLTITYGLVKKLQGDISVKSKLDEGTTFTITLPARIHKEINGNEGSIGG